MLAQPDMDTISVSMRTFEDVDEFVAASGNPNLAPDEKKALKEYGLFLDRNYCRPGCDACLAACPDDVPIHDILRYRLYFDNYGREKYAMGLYAALPDSKKAHRCDTCSGQCVSSCPHGIPIREKLVQAHSELIV